MAAYDFDRPYISRSRFQLYRVTDPATATVYGNHVMATPFSNIEYKTRFERCAKTHPMKAPPSCGRIFMGYLTLRHLGDKARAYETWIPADGFEHSHVLEVDFTSMSRRELLTYLVKQYADLGAGPLPVEDAVGYWEKGFDREKRGLYLLRLPSGFAMMQQPTDQPLEENKMARCSRLHALYLHPAARGVGIGRDLVDWAKASCTEGEPLLLMCYGDHRREFFSHLGFKVLHPLQDGCEMLFRV